MRWPSWLLGFFSLVACGTSDPSTGVMQCGPNGNCPVGYTCTAANFCVLGDMSVDARVLMDGPAVALDAARTDSAPAIGDAGPASGSMDAAPPADGAPLSLDAARPPDAPVLPPDAAVEPDAHPAPPDARVFPPDAPKTPDAPPGAVETLLDSTPADATNDPNATFAFSSDTAGASFECALETPPVFAPCASPVAFPGLADGTHVFAVRATAKGVTDETPATFTWTIDTTGPSVALTGPSGGQTTGRTVAFGFTAETGATFACALDGAGLAACPGGTKTFTLLAGGAHTFSVQAADALGNPGPLATADFTVDATGPTVTIAPLAMNQAGRDGTITYSADEGATFACRLDGASFAVCPASGFVFSGLAAGPHTLTVHGTDGFGNTGADASYSFTVTGPVEVLVMDGFDPVPFAQVGGIGADFDATTESITTADASGHASIVVPPGGIVEVLHAQSNQFSFSYSIVGVQPFESIVLGRINTNPDGGGFSVQRTFEAVPPGTTCVSNDVGARPAGCVDVANPKTVNFGNDDLDSTGKANLLLAAVSSLPNVLAYAWAPGIAPVAGGSVAASAWQASVAQPMTIAHINPSIGVVPGVGMNGIFISSSSATFRVLTPTDLFTTMAHVPPAGIGDHVLYRFQASGLVISDATTFDAAADVLPQATSPTFSTDPRTGKAVLSYGGLPASSFVVLKSDASEGSFAKQTIVVAPATGQLTVPDLFHQPALPGGASNRSLWGIDDDGLSAAEFRQRNRELFRAASIVQGPMPDPGPGHVFRATNTPF